MNVSKSQEAIVSMCPGCGRHLGDTWNGEKCGECGFAYIFERGARMTSSRTRQRSPYPIDGSLTAGICAVFSAVFAGTSMANSSFLATTKTAEGIAISSTGPDAAFWWFGGLFVLAIVLLCVALALEGMP